MFNKNSSLNVEFLPDGKYVVKFHIGKHAKAEMVSNFINGIITREYLEGLLDSILESGRKKDKMDLAEDICNRIIVAQNNIEVRAVRKGRSPIIKPSKVMSSLMGGNNDE